MPSSRSVVVLYSRQFSACPKQYQGAPHGENPESVSQARHLHSAQLLLKELKPSIVYSQQPGFTLVLIDFMI
jgi:hypothetical protein